MTIVVGDDQPVALPLTGSRRRDLKSNVPIADATNVLVGEVVPVTQSTNDLPGLSICTSNKSPLGGACSPQLNEKLVEVVPTLGADDGDTLTVPVKALLDGSWIGNPPAYANDSVKAAPTLKVPDLNSPRPDASEITRRLGPEFVHWTVPPSGTCLTEGAKYESWAST